MKRLTLHRIVSSLHRFYCPALLVDIQASGYRNRLAVMEASNKAGGIGVVWQLADTSSGEQWQRRGLGVVVVPGEY